LNVLIADAPDEHRNRGVEVRFADRRRDLLPRRSEAVRIRPSRAGGAFPRAFETFTTTTSLPVPRYWQTSASFELFSGRPKALPMASAVT
jgi:hypothetical protein